MNTNSEAPSLLLVWRTWHSTHLIAVLGVCAVIAVLLLGWVQSDGEKALESEHARLVAIAETIKAANTDGANPLDPASLENWATSLPRIASITVFKTPVSQADALPGMVIVSVPLGDNLGFLVLEGELGSESSLSAYAVPFAISVVIGFVVLLAGVSFAKASAGVRRVASALTAIERGEVDRECLLVSERFGTVATTWNRVISPADATETLRLDSGEDGSDRRDGGFDGSDISTKTLDAIPVGIVGIDKNDRLLFCNGAAATMLGVDRGSVLAEPYSSIDALADAQDSIRPVSDGEIPRSSVELSRGDIGNEHNLKISVRSLRKTDGAHVLLMIEDVTQQRLADASRDTFVAQATHELRTPLTNIRLAAEEAIDAMQTDPASVSMSLNIVNTEARRLELVVSDMLSVSEMEAASISLNIDDVSLGGLLDNIESDYRGQAREHSLEFTVGKPAKLEPVMGDREKISVLLHNLVGNAIKYTPRGGSVSVSAMQDEQDWAVTVRDTGSGIAPDEQDKVFDKFYRASNAKNSDLVGSGLGLALAAEIARLHGGEITLESELGVGSTFTVRIPRGIQSAGALAA